MAWAFISVVETEPLTQFSDLPQGMQYMHMDYYQMCALKLLDVVSYPGLTTVMQVALFLRFSFPSIKYKP